jgi:hypothetical protein
VFTSVLTLNSVLAAEGASYYYCSAASFNDWMSLSTKHVIVVPLETV